MKQFLFSKLGLGSLFLVGVILSKLDPFSLNPLGYMEFTKLPLTYFTPFIISLLWSNLFPDEMSRKSAGEIKEEWVQKAKSLLRSVLQLSGVFIALGGLGVKIPFIEPVLNALNYLAANMDIAVNALNIVIGFGITIYGFFKDQNRFEDRADKPYKDNKLA